MKANSTRFNFLGRKGSIMKNVKGLFFLACLAFGLIGCIPQGDNINTYTAPSVISYDATGNTVMNDLTTGTTYAPSLNNDINITSGSCGIAQYTINYDNQPAGTVAGKYTATEVYWTPVSKSSIYNTSGEMSNLGYNDTIFNVELFSGNYLLKNMIFMAMAHQKMPQDRTYNYQLIWNTDSVKLEKVKEKEIEISTLYLVAKTATSGTGTTGTYLFPYAFNMSSFINMTTEDDDRENVKQRHFNLMYQSGLDSEGKPKFTPHPNNPLVVYKIKE